MFDLLATHLKYPPIYTKDVSNFWTDEHISKKLLETHLDPDEELASRKPGFMDRSAEWISTVIPPSKYPRLLDLGCGPGLYAQRFAKAGYAVTGLDFSRRSIDHAIQTAKDMDLPITYLQANYLEWAPKAVYDAAVMIYCDYCALSAEDRKRLMGKVYNCLLPGGRFLLDVSTIREYDESTEGQTWELCENGGFWSAEPYICLNARRRYEDHTLLNLNVVITGKETKAYHIWHHCFTRESMLAEAEGAGFSAIGWYDDIAGEPYADEGKTMAVLLQKR